MSGEWYLPPQIRAIRQAQREEYERSGTQPARPIPKVLCSFCYKSEPDVEVVWATPGKSEAICSQCIERSHNALLEWRRVRK